MHLHLTYPSCIWRLPGLSCGVVCVILRLAVSVEHRIVTDRRTDRQTDRQTIRLFFLWPHCTPRSECPQFRMHAERRAQFRVPNVPRCRISERAPFRIYKHAQCGLFERTCLQCACHTLLAANGVVRCATGTPQRVVACSEHAVLAASA